MRVATDAARRMLSFAVAVPAAVVAVTLSSRLSATARFASLVSRKSPPSMLTPGQFGSTLHCASVPPKSSNRASTSASTSPGMSSWSGPVRLSPVYPHSRKSSFASASSQPVPEAGLLSRSSGWSPFTCSRYPSAPSSSGAASDVKLSSDGSPASKQPGNSDDAVSSFRLSGKRSSFSCGQPAKAVRSAVSRPSGSLSSSSRAQPAKAKPATPTAPSCSSDTVSCTAPPGQQSRTARLSGPLYNMPFSEKKPVFPELTFTSFSPSQKAKAPTPISAVPSGMLRLVSPLPAKANGPISASFFGSVITSRLDAPRNAASPMYVTVLLRVTDFSLGQP